MGDGSLVGAIVGKGDGGSGLVFWDKREGGLTCVRTASTRITMGMMITALETVSKNV